MEFIKFSKWHKLGAVVIVAMMIMTAGIMLIDNDESDAAISVNGSGTVGDPVKNLNGTVEEMLDFFEIGLTDNTTETDTLYVVVGATITIRGSTDNESYDASAQLYTSNDFKTSTANSNGLTTTPHGSAGSSVTGTIAESPIYVRISYYVSGTHDITTTLNLTIIIASTESSTVNVYRGASCEWTPTTSVAAEFTVSAAGNAMPTSGYSNTSGYASIQGGKLVVSIPSDYAGSKYYVSVKAVSTQPTQTAYYNITFNIYDQVSIGTNGTFYEAVGGAFDSYKVNFVGATNYTITSSNTNIVNIDHNGNVTPGTNITVGTYTVTLTITDTDSPSNTATATLNVIVKAQLVYTNDPSSIVIN